MSRRALEFSETELVQALASVRVIRGLYYTTHPIPDAEGIGARHIDLVLGLIREELALRQVLDPAARRYFTRRELLQARALLVAVRGAYYGQHYGDAGQAGDRHVDLILDLVLDEIDRTPKGEEKGMS